MAQASKFWDKIAAKYARLPVADEDAYQKKLQITRGYLTPRSEVVEIGCGTGTTAIAHAPYAHQILAVDISPKMLAFAQSKADAAGIINITFSASSIDDLRVPDESQDVVLALSVLHLLEDKEATIAQIYQMLKPGGVFVSSTICLADTMKYMKLIAPIGKLFGFMPLLKVFSMVDLEATITNAGFAIDHCWHPGKGKAIFFVAKKPD